ncbi:MAG: winged helix-turn-helix transcriptional regulator [Ktedonobacterales bacterium]|nr:winged helix-turn-helix transcriptional regulator [Ktedonobacterales bacterium]
MHTPTHPVPEHTQPCCENTPLPMLAPARATTLAERLKALADPTRLRMLDLLTQQPAPLCVCDITSRFVLRQPTISHHLRLLREAGLIAGEKRGVWSYYQATEAGRACLIAVRALP